MRLLAIALVVEVRLWLAGFMIREILFDVSVNRADLVGFLPCCRFTLGVICAMIGFLAVKAEFLVDTSPFLFCGQLAAIPFVC